MTKVLLAISELRDGLNTLTLIYLPSLKMFGSNIVGIDSF